MQGEKLTRLGAGPVATAFVAELNGTLSVLKVFPTRFDRRTMSAAGRELSRLRNAWVPPILMPYGIEQLPDGRHAVRTELCTQSLATLIQRHGVLSSYDTLVLGHAVATGLAAAHSVNVVHGGVNPHNVLFRASGEPVVADFGVVLRRAFARDPMRSIEWLPPECLRDDVLDPRTDLYGLGAILHFALTGRPPHPGRLGERLGERVLRVLREPVPPIVQQGVPPQLSGLISHLLAPDPAARPESAEAITYHLASLLARPYQENQAPVPQPAQPPPPPPPAQPAQPQPQQQQQQQPIEPYPQHSPLRSQLPPARPVQAARRPPRPIPAGELSYLPPVEPEPIPPAATPEASAMQEILAPPEEKPEESLFDDFQENDDPKTPSEPAPAPLNQAIPLVSTDDFDADFDDQFGDQDFGDFAAQPQAAQPYEPAPPVSQPPEPKPDAHRHIPYKLLIGAAALVVAVSLPLVLILQAGPAELRTTPRPVQTRVDAAAPASPSPKPVLVELTAPTDLGNAVVLNWTSSAANLDFAVVIAQENGPTKVLIASRTHSMNVPVDPARKYCFQIQAADSDTADTQVYESKPQAVRGAVCKA